MSFDWQTLVKGVAPVLGGLFGGPLGAAATGALANAILGDKASGDPLKDSEALASALAGGITPEVRAKIIEAETSIKLAAMQFADNEKARELDLAKAELSDLKSARERDVEFVRANRYNARADILAFLAVGGLLVCMYFIVRDSTLPERAVNAIMFVAGVFAASVRDVYSFEFGSSRGSKEKDAALAGRPK